MNGSMDFPSLLLHNDSEAKEEEEEEERRRGRGISNYRQRIFPPFPFLLHPIHLQPSINRPHHLPGHVNSHLPHFPNDRKLPPDSFPFTTTPPLFITTATATTTTRIGAGGQYCPLA